MNEIATDSLFRQRHRHFTVYCDSKITILPLGGEKNTILSLGVEKLPFLIFQITILSLGAEKIPFFIFSGDMNGISEFFA